MKILVLGGSRFLGRTFVEEAQMQNHEVTIFNRGNQNEGFQDVEILTGDRFGDLNELKSRYWDAVLDTSGFIPSSVLMSTDLLKDRVKHYTFISSISVYQDWVQENFDEKYPVYAMSLEEANKLSKNSNGYEYYGQFKALCEVIAEKNLPGRVLNVRAGQLIGPNDYTDRIPFWIHRIAAGGKVLAPGNPNRPVQMIDNQDLAQWILSMMASQSAGTFNATGPDYTLTMGEFLENCKKVTGSNAEIVWCDEKFLLDQGVAPWTEMPLWVPEEFPLEPELNEPWKGAFSVNIEKAIASGLTFRPLEESLTEIYEWEKQRNLASDEWKSGMSRDREEELLQLWSRSNV
ncbi:NAD-dependent epimerase/dehydratase family protein [Neobacillus sp. CF12]|uniref:NAD-dependent epimerase/dehydratase family protein n=1 Tax=Neobacillus sp. CF12 TaxID=3055864 RepID=UPI0025A26ECC|nr:NAD-dependent epimerase/dehydratase family protein [Neobacillus sp. CF12]MDM5326511.1 NAD-dependent epimerase/dehydratase family protein [Neobacillus sp. CF12]